MFKSDFIEWTHATGSRGAYERSSDTDNPEFQKLLEMLRANHNQLTHEGYYYWLFSGGEVIGRKQKGKR